MVFIGIYHLLFYLIQSIQFSQMKEVRVCLLNYIMHGVTMMCSAHCNRYLLNGRHLFKGLDPVNQLLLSKTILFTHSPADLNYSPETCMIHVRAP